MTSALSKRDVQLSLQTHEKNFNDILNWVQNPIDKAEMYRTQDFKIKFLDEIRDNYAKERLDFTDNRFSILEVHDQNARLLFSALTTGPNGTQLAHRVKWIKFYVGRSFPTDIRWEPRFLPNLHTLEMVEDNERNGIALDGVLQLLVRGSNVAVLRITKTIGNRLLSVVDGFVRTGNLTDTMQSLIVDNLFDEPKCLRRTDAGDFLPCRMFGLLGNVLCAHSFRSVQLPMHVALGMISRDLPNPTGKIDELILVDSGKRFSTTPVEDWWRVVGRSNIGRITIHWDVTAYQPMFGGGAPRRSPDSRLTSPVLLMVRIPTDTLVTGDIQNSVYDMKTLLYSTANVCLWMKPAPPKRTAYPGVLSTSFVGMQRHIVSSIAHGMHTRMAVRLFITANENDYVSNTLSDHLGWYVLMSEALFRSAYRTGVDVRLILDSSAFVLPPPRTTLDWTDSDVSGAFRGACARILKQPVVCESAIRSWESGNIKYIAPGTKRSTDEADGLFLGFPMHTIERQRNNRASKKRTREDLE